MKVILVTLALFAFTIAAPPPEGRIYGGEDAKRYQYPYQVSLHRRENENYNFTHACGASIIAPNWIVTAAHCTQYDPTHFLVVAGILDLNETTPDRQEASVILVVNHPGYRPENNLGVGPNDISLLQLDRSLEYTDAVQPIGIPTEEYVPSGDAELSGWGSIRGPDSLPVKPVRLQRAVLPFISIDECRNSFDTIVGAENDLLDDEFNVCSGSKSGDQSTCSGDSGGPWAQNGVILGIVSWGLDPCGYEGAPSVYTYVKAYREWVKTYVPDV